jgi:hypothetical protein
MNGTVNPGQSTRAAGPILALISQLLSALDAVQRHHLKQSPAGDPSAAPRLRQVDSPGICIL